MKSAKKLLLLVLSIVLLIGVFAVAVLADDAPEAAATVEYPDGTVDRYTAAGNISPSIPVEGGLFYGKGNTLYKDAGLGWIYTDEAGNTVTGITADMIAAGAKITASGFDKVYYTHTTEGVTTYDTSASEYAANLKSLLNYPALTGSDLKMYADASMTNIVLRGAHGGIKNYLDLNGHKLTITNSATHAIESRAPHFAIYSSQPGAEINASGCTNLLYSNDDGASDKEYDTHYNLASKCQHAGKLYFGERVTPSETERGEYGKNITVYGQGFKATLYGGNVYIYGGTFVQTGAAANFIVYTNRTPVFMHADFVLTNATSAVVTTNGNVKSFTDCNFVYTGDGSIALTTAATAATFTNCNFVNVLPSYSAGHAYPGCSFGTTSIFTTEDLNPSETAAVYLAHGENAETITVNGETYTLDGVLINAPSEALKLTLEGLSTEYWMVGTKPSFEAEANTVVLNGKICSDPSYDYSAIVQVDETGTVIGTGEATAPLKFNTVGADAAFTYQVAGEEMQFVASTGDPIEDGANFYTYLNDKSNVTIKMYSDIILENGILFGTLKEAIDDDKDTVYVLDQTGDVDWDLNGYTVTVTADVTPITVVVKDTGSHNFSALHWIGTHTFKLYSSVEGGEYINQSAYSIFGVSKYGSGSVGAGAQSYVVGTNDPTLCGGDNLTVTTKGGLIEGYESSGASGSPLKAYLTINGGTYVYEGSKALMMVGDTNVVKNATFITTGAATAVFSNMFWKAANLTLENITVFAANDATKLAIAGNKGAPQTAVAATHKITLNGAVLLGKGLKPEYNVKTDKVTYTVIPTGNIIASDKGVLDIAYPTIPEGKNLANVGITVNGETVLAMSYADASEVVTVTNAQTGTSEYWLVGDGYKFIAGEASSTILKIDGVWFYYAAPTWGATLGESPIELDSICASENAGATVMLTIEGDRDLLAFTYQVDGEEVEYVLAEETPEDNGVNFVATVGHLSNIKIVMYTDIVLTQGVLFGTMNDPDDKGHSVKLKTSGYVDWDLNGYKVTVDENAAPLIMKMPSNDGYRSFNVLHYIGTYTFKLYSSVEGGKYINNSSYAICGVYKYSDECPSYLFGTNDHTECGGDNLTVETNGPLVQGYESSNAPSSPLDAYLYINGGTYIYHGDKAFALVGSDNKLYNATIVTTGAAKAVLVNHYYRNATTVVDNLVVLAKNELTMFIASGDYNGPTMNLYTTAHKITVGNVTLIGDGLALAHNVTNKNHTYTVNGKVMASNKAILDSVYSAAPAGKVLAFAGVKVCGIDGIVMSYEDAANTVTVIDVAGESAFWLVGENYFYIATDPSNASMVKENGGWYYYTDPVWSAILGDASIELDAICDSANKGKTVTLTITGEKEILYYTVTVDGVTTYYCGEEAASDFKSLLTPDAVKTYEIKFYNDFTINTDVNSLQIGVKNGSVATYKFDLNGYKWTVASTNLYAINPKAVHVYIYSTAPGGELDVSSASGIFMVDDGGYFYLGEPSSTCTSYGKNLTVHCKTIMASDIWSNGYSIYGGTYIQPEGVSAKYFFNAQRLAPTALRNATFIMQNVEYFAHGMRLGIASSTADVITNCTFISLNGKTQLFDVSTINKDKNTKFTYCNFYNIINNTYEDITIEYQDCKFSVSSPDEQVGGYIAYTGVSDTVTVNGVDYVFGAQLVESATLVDWGFGLTDYWVEGATATHEDVLVDGVFIYAFHPFTVQAGSNTVESYLKTIAENAVQMSLTLKNQISANVLFAEALEGKATITVNGNPVSFDKIENGFGKYTLTFAPTVADTPIVIVVTVGEVELKTTWSVDMYAAAILASEAHAAVHHLTYAMIEYVRSMDADFCAGVAAPAGYEAKTLEAVEPENPETNTLLTELCFNLSETIEIQFKGIAEDGTDVNLILATTRSEHAEMMNGLVTFTDLYINEILGDMTIKVDNETYSYSLANYLHGIGGESPAVRALYNYAFHADAYVKTLPGYGT